jgi:Ca2+-binding EF-hand superfamily protein
MTGASALLVLALASAPGQETAPAATEGEAARHLVFLADRRPIFLRLRITSQGRPLDASWIESVRAIHATLDRNGDGTVTTKEADEKTFAALVRLAVAAGTDVPPARGDLDVDPKDGKVSVEELAEALRPILGPFRLQFRRQGVGRTDALFDQLDRDKDGQLSGSELGPIAGSLRPLDLDDDEMIAAHELEPFNSPAFTAMMDETSDRRARYTELSPVVELAAGESSLRPARSLLKKYDKPSEDGRGRPDGKLSSSEFAIDPAAFARADTNKDDALDANELRRFLEKAPVDLTLDLVVSPEASGRSTIQVGDGGRLPEGAQVKQLADGDVEFAIGDVRLDIHIEPGTTAADEVRRVLTQRFKAADANKDGYIEGKERAALDGPQSPLAGLWEVIDRDGDGKVYLKDLLAFGDRQAEAARRRLIMTTDDQGRAIFRILDSDRDRRLGAREVMRTVDRVMSWDKDGDGRVSPDEIPYHFLVTIARSGLPGLTGEAAGNRAPRAMAATSSSAGPATGPDWFQKMDRNHDGDVSRREFLGPRDQFNRLDRDKDGLIDADEASAGTSPTKTSGDRP